MSTIEYLSNKLDNVLNEIFKQHAHKCKKINFKYPNVKNNFILYSLKDVMKYFLHDNNITETKILEIDKTINELIKEKHQYIVKDLKEKHMVTSNMTIESYMNYQTLLNFKEEEMNDIYIDKIGLYKVLIIIQPELIKTFKEFALNIILDTLDKKLYKEKEEPITYKVCEKLDHLIKVIDTLTNSNKQLIEKNHYLTKKNQILDENIESLQKDVAKTKEILTDIFNDFIKV